MTTVAEIADLMFQVCIRLILFDLKRCVKVQEQLHEVDKSLKRVVSHCVGLNVLYMEA